jgi:L-ascorbate metabolism protein UlaG (beta-lactamase superfamily)
LGFEVSLGGKTLYFSGDTYYDKNELKKGRYEEMAFRDFSKYDIIIHEAGIPPIHTP